MSSGYYRFPTISKDRIVFVSEDDLWEVPTEGGVARRLTAGRGECKYPVLSPDGTQLAFLGTEEGTSEVYVMDAQGGPARQLTFWNTRAAVVGWSGGDIVFRSSHQQHTPRQVVLYRVSAQGGAPRAIDVGPAVSYASRDGGAIAIARFADDLARWKRYKGGTAAAIWVSQDGTWARLFADQTSGHACPMWLGERLFFVTDKDGYANIYSSNADGSDVRQETYHKGFYVRGAQTDGARIVYTQGGDLWVFTPGQETQKIDVAFASSRTQLNRKFVDAEDYLDDLDFNPKGDRISAIARGKLFNMGLWEGGVRQLGVEQGVRYGQCVWLDDDRQLVTSDEGGEVRFEIHASDGSKIEILEPSLDIGRPIDIKLSPKGDRIAFSNHRQDIIVFNLETSQAEVIDHSDWSPLGGGFDFSHDGRFLAYALAESAQTSAIKIRSFDDGQTHNVTRGEFKDTTPIFDPEGRYLYFLSHRFFEPVYDQLFFEISFPAAMKPCVLTLRDDVPSLFIEVSRPLEEADDDKHDSAESNEEDDTNEANNEGEDAQKDKKTEGEEKDDDKLLIDFEGIEDRIQAFPAPVGSYSQLAATADRVFWTQATAEVLDGKDESNLMRYFVVKDREVKTFATDVLGFTLSANGKSMAVWCKDGVRVLPASAGGVDDLTDGEKPGRKSGWLDFGRINVSVDLRAEWRQMLREAWRLMRDHYWSKMMAGVDWGEVWTRYEPLVERVGSRSEFSDLVWTMQGEMGTSHAYEIGGDYRHPPTYMPASLGANIVWDQGRGAYRIDHIVRGDTWSEDASSPLARPGLDVKIGDFILAVNGRALEETSTLEEHLVKQVRREVELKVQRGDEEPRYVTVKTIGSDTSARYREWVNANRDAVHKATGSRVGYVHVPDMSVHGFAEFHRGYLTEVRRQALIVDVRFNGGGHVSQLLLEKLARTRIGYDLTRHGGVFPYPSDSMPGPIVAITDEHAGSDGDIFSHCFKLMKLGTLVGKRTWGGVVGIWPRHGLVDGSYTTQPEFAFWFEDVGFGVENYGTDPDIEVEYSPKDHADGVDPQLNRAIEVVISQLEQAPGNPDFGPHPNLAPKV